MKIFSKFFNPKTFEEKLPHLKHIDFSLFVDDIPKSSADLSSINILVLAEPNEYFGLHDWAFKNHHLFQAILTWDDKLLNQCDTAVFFPFGQTWLKPYQYETPKLKEFKLAHLCGVLNKTYGHSMRHEILARNDEFKIPTKFYHTVGDRHDEATVHLGKEEVFGDAQFGVVIENFSHRGYFSEKLIDCFLMKTVPIYWGCSNIYEFFDTDGIIPFTNVDDIVFISKMLHSNGYENRKNAIEHNYQTALKYINYEQSIINKLEEIFKLNTLI